MGGCRHAARPVPQRHDPELARELLVALNYRLHTIANWHRHGHRYLPIGIAPVRPRHANRTQMKPPTPHTYHFFKYCTATHIGHWDIADQIARNRKWRVACSRFPQVSQHPENTYTSMRNVIRVFSFSRRTLLDCSTTTSYYVRGHGTYTCTVQCTSYSTRVYLLYPVLYTARPATVELE